MSKKTLTDDKKIPKINFNTRQIKILISGENLPIGANETAYLAKAKIIEK